MLQTMMSTHSEQNSDTTICHDYAYGIFQRASKPIEVPGFRPNWQDQPSRYKLFRDVDRIPLPTAFPEHLATMAEIIARINAPIQSARPFTLQELSTLLQFAHGVLGRRLRVNWNLDQRERSNYVTTTYNRGTASGGGMYPTEIHWVCGESAPLAAGIYHYDNAHHALERLFIGNVSQHVRTALQHLPAAQETDQFLLISLNFWKNAFKYNNFCYHVVTQDLGALLASLRFLSLGMGVTLPSVFWFHDEQLNRLLGLETLSESVFAAIPLPTGLDRQEEPEAAPTLLQAPLFTKTSFQRSQKVIRFELNERVHQSALVTDTPRPERSSSLEAGLDIEEDDRETIQLPPPTLDALKDDLLNVFRKRQSSFGNFSQQKHLSLEELSTILAVGSKARHYVSDLNEVDGSSNFTQLMVFVNNVEHVLKGAYSYDHKQHSLHTVLKEDLRWFLQQHYFLQNYSLPEAAAVLVITGSVDRMLERFGNRGYRILNAEVGTVAQSVYLTASALSIGCGAVLGFDNVAVNKVLSLDGTDRSSMLFLIVGHERPNKADFDSQLT